MSHITNRIHVRATGAGVMAEAYTPLGELVLESVRLHLSAAGGAVEDFTVEADSPTNAAYDAVFLAQDMNTVTDVLWIPDADLAIEKGQVIDFNYANGNTRTWGLEFVLRKDY